MKVEQKGRADRPGEDDAKRAVGVGRGEKRGLGQRGLLHVISFTGSPSKLVSLRYLVPRRACLSGGFFLPMPSIWQNDSPSPSCTACAMLCSLRSLQHMNNHREQIHGSKGKAIGCLLLESLVTPRRISLDRTSDVIGAARGRRVFLDLFASS